MSKVQANWAWRSQFLSNEATRLDRKADDLRKEAQGLRELARKINPTDGTVSNGER